MPDLRAMGDRMIKLSPDDCRIVDALTDLLSDMGVEPIVGEKLFAWLIGLSVGLRAGSLKDEHILETMVEGFIAGAHVGPRSNMGD